MQIRGDLYSPTNLKAFLIFVLNDRDCVEQEKAHSTHSKYDKGLDFFQSKEKTDEEGRII
jgi:hypothetical protein